MTTNLHLLCSVFVTPHGFNHYRTKKLNPKGDQFRVGRFLTMLLSIRNIDFDSSHFYISLDPIWENDFSEIENFIRLLFPNSVIEQGRIDNIENWIIASRRFPKDDIILLQTNDDHAFVAQNNSSLMNLVNLMYGSADLKLGSITHHPEFSGLRNVKDSFVLDDDHDYILVNDAIGTQLIKADFFQNWWTDLGSRGTAELKITRPDNPFGASIKFTSSKLVIPKYEIFRHMDGYSHCGLYRPIPPLRNLIEMKDIKIYMNKDDRSSFVRLEDFPYWNYSNWPAKLFGYSSKGADIHKTNFQTTTGYLNQIRAGISFLQLNYSFRLSLNNFPIALSRNHFNSKFQRFLIIIFGFFTFPILRNVPDLIFDRSTKCLQYIMKFTLKKTFRLPEIIIYHGIFRGCALFFRRNHKLKVFVRGYMRSLIRAKFDYLIKLIKSIFKLGSA
jgi:hypothetical protein